MSKSLVIVESPAKGKTIEKYLGKGTKVLASYGHVRDLVPKTGAIDTENDFAMKYQIIDRNKKHVDKIVKALKNVDNLYLATDPDREGEAISWHLLELLKEKNVLEGINVQRVVFHEITKTAVQEAVANPRGLSMPMVDAQQARRALDYLVGFNISPLLWKKIKPGLSAGRVQSPALRMIVERDEEIEAFNPKEYWTLQGLVDKNGEEFSPKLHTYEGKALKQFDLNNEKDATAAKNKLLKDANGNVTVTRLEKKQRRRQPTAPFTTSTLQQEGSRKLYFNTRRTMSVAQQLYEGIDLGDGPVGLITYMRTDSVTLANEAVDEIRTLIIERYGKDFVNPEPRKFKTKSKNAQEAHEAIRPTSAFHVPSEIKKYLTDEQYKLYSLIWKRTIACQMIHATMNTVSADLSPNDDSFFRATGSSIHHAGFMRVYKEGLDDGAKDNSKEKILPEMEQGDVLTLHEISADQHFTDPPPRYSEASLVKTLEEYDIGRPSTYASIISTLQSREYVEIESRRFFPTDIGKIVSRFLTMHFTKYVDYDFTANLEGQLDDVSLGEKNWIPLLKDFWEPFHELVVDKDANVSREEVMQARVLGDHPENGKPVSVRMGRYGPFVQCGTKDDEDKPKFASLLPGQKMDSVTLDDAMVLFQLPRDLGETPEGEKMSTNFGRFGPYVKYGSKFVSLPKDEDINPYTITPERALKLVVDKKQADLDRIIASWEEEGIQILKGRWGPYITDGNKNAKMPSKDYDPTTLSLEECQELLAKAPERKGRGKKKAGKKAAPKKKELTPKQLEAKAKREEKANAKKAEKARLRRNLLAKKRRAKAKKEKEKTEKADVVAKKKVADAKRKAAIAKKKS